MKNPIKTKRAAISALAFVAVAGIATAAFAAFYETTTATAPAAAAEMSALQITVPASLDYQGDDDALWPNHPADVKVTVKNNNEVPVNVTSITSVSVVATGSTPSDCDDNVTIDSTPNYGTVSLSASGVAGDTQEVVVDDLVTLADTAPNYCQSGTFTVSMILTGTAQ